MAERKQNKKAPGQNIASKDMTPVTYSLYPGPTFHNTTKS
jgi:hypothetical protein